MAISVVQSGSATQQAAGAMTINFSSNVTTGNSVVLIPQGFNLSGSASSTPTYNGSTPSGSAKLAELSPTVVSTQGVYAGVWLMPNLTGGSKSVGITMTGGNNGFTAVEVAGLGAAPQLDANGGSSTGSGSDASTGMPSGNTPALSASSAILIGTGAAFAVSSYSTPGGWTNLSFASFSCAQYQIVTSASGNTYQYNPSDGSVGWGSIIVALTQQPSSGVSSSFLAFFS